jgi:hypothetical protein
MAKKVGITIKKMVMSTELIMFSVQTVQYLRVIKHA